MEDWIESAHMHLFANWPHMLSSFYTRWHCMSDVRISSHCEYTISNMLSLEQTCKHFGLIKQLFLAEQWQQNSTQLPAGNELYITEST